MKSSSRDSPHWTFLTNHGRVLAFITDAPTARVRDIATGVGVTERTASQIVSDLEQAKYLRKVRSGRRNHYVLLDRKKHRRAKAETVAAGQLMALLLDLFEHQPFG